MSFSIRAHRLLYLCLFSLFAALSAVGQTRLVISQMYGGGGNTGAPFTNDFVELYNPTSAAISLNGLSIQYAAATSASWNAVALPNASVQPGHYFLIQAAAGTTVTNMPLVPAADFVISTSGSTGNQLNFSATAGKIVIARSTTPLTVACPAATAYVDLIGFGTTANCFEGTGPAPAPSNTTADIRNNLAVDLVNNATDFITGAPVPHNSGSASAPATPPVLFIHDIQGAKSTTSSTVSPYAGQRVTTSGVVTSVLSNAFFLQSRDADADSNPLTPEGIEIFTSSAPTVALGNYVQVTGTVQTYPAVTVSKTPATEITSPTVTLLSAVSPLPTPVTLTTAMLSPTGGLYQLTPYEGMRVSVPSMTTTSGTNGSITSSNEVTETATSTGYFYAVITGTPRPFREPGIDIRDPAVPGTPAGVAHFDDNPERIIVNSVLTGGPSIEVSTGAVLVNVTGVLDFTFSSDAFYDPSRLILDASYNRASVTPGLTVQPAALPASNEFTVASFNIERFYNTNSADDLYFVPAGVAGFNGSSGTGTVSTGQTFTSAAVDVTAAAYARRLQKLSLAIRTVLNSPDIVTLEEVENQSVANDIATQVNTDAGVPNLYTAYSTDNTTLYSQDGTGISVGFLVKNTVDTLGFSQFGARESFTPSSGSNPITLNDRPWLVLNAGVKRGTGTKDYPVTVIVNHMKALTGQNSPTSTSTRQKKELQAEDIAKYIQTLQAAGQHVISGGDFNAFEFADGYNDTLGTYTNTNVLPATQVLQPGVAGLVTPPLTDLALTLPANQRWSYVEDGSAQILDHMVVTPELVSGGGHFAYVHLNADFPLTAYNDATTAARVSDHDVALGYFALPAPVLSGTLSPTSGSFGSVPTGVSSTGQVFTFTNTGEGPVTVTGVTTTGDFAVSTNCTTVAVSSTCSANVVFKPTSVGSRSGTVTFTTNVPSATFTSTLSGAGLVPDFALADASGSTTSSLTLVAGTFGTVALTLTPINSFSGAVTVTCAAAGTAPAGVTCAPASPVTVGAAPATLNVTLTTTSRIYSSGLPLMRSARAVGLSGLFLASMLLLLSRGRRVALEGISGKLLTLLMLTGLGAACLSISGCGNGGSAHTPSNGTPAGTYTYTVSATSGTLSHTQTIVLNVQ